LSDVAISKAIIVRELREMKGNKAAGEDGLGSTFLKEIEDAVAAPLEVLFKMVSFPLIGKWQILLLYTKKGQSRIQKL